MKLERRVYISIRASYDAVPPKYAEQNELAEAPLACKPRRQLSALHVPRFSSNGVRWPNAICNRENARAIRKAESMTGYVIKRKET